MKKRLGAIFMIVAFVVTLGATGVFAAVALVTGNIQLLVTPPTSVVAGALDSDEYIRVFDENQDVFLTSDLLTDSFPGITGQTIPAGTFVNSQFIHFDPSTSATLPGTITFDSAILGLFTTNDGLDKTDGIFGLAGTTYPTGNNRKTDEAGPNADTVSYTGPILTITLKAQDGIDQIRVITEGDGTPVAVDIDIKPGSDPNSINLGSKGVIPVAILGSASFDAATVDPFTVKLANAAVKVKGKSGNAGSLEDVNDDGYLDLVVHFYTQDLALSPGDIEAALWGLTYGGIAIGGSDSIRTVPPE